MLKSWETIQAEQRDWVRQNFPGRALHQPVLGIGEEVGELIEAHWRRQPEKRDDALGDIAIYALNLCSNEGWAFTDLHAAAEQRGQAPGNWQRYAWGDAERMLPKLSIFVGRLCHSFLKREQGIRGTWEEHTLALYRALADLWCQLLLYAAVLGIEPLAVVGRTWTAVGARDWQADPVGGAR